VLEKTKEVLSFLSQDSFFSENDIRFVGGTALSYLINHRLSEDLDFATLTFDPKIINTFMTKYGATEIEHSDNIKDYALNQGEDI
jgi:predicted nucleotidyltransferase component of viral defense system